MLLNLPSPRGQGPPTAMVAADFQEPCSCLKDYCRASILQGLPFRLFEEVSKSVQVRFNDIEAVTVPTLRILV